MCHFCCCCFFLIKAEKVSLHGFNNMLLVIPYALVWAVLPSDLLAFGADFLQSMILGVSIPLIVMVILTFMILIEMIIIILIIIIIIITIIIIIITLLIIINK